MRLYSLHEIAGLVRQAGMAVVGVHENARGAPYAVRGPHLTLLATKEEQG